MASLTMRGTILSITVLLSVGVALALVSSGLLTGSDDPYPPQDSVILEGEPTQQVVFATQEGRHIQTVDVWIADTPAAQYQGLSDTERADLPPGTGLLFVYDSERERSLVMREMRYPLEMVFIATNGTVTAVYEAAVEASGKSDQELTWYTAQAQYILEVPQGRINDSLEPGVQADIL